MAKTYGQERRGEAAENKLLADNVLVALDSRGVLFVTTVTFLAITPAVAPSQIIYCIPASDR